MEPQNNSKANSPFNVVVIGTESSANKSSNMPMTNIFNINHYYIEKFIYMERKMAFIYIERKRVNK